MPRRAPRKGNFHRLPSFQKMAVRAFKSIKRRVETWFPHQRGRSTFPTFPWQSRFSQTVRVTPETRRRRSSNPLQWVLQNFVNGRGLRNTTAGFVLPTTILTVLLLVLVSSTLVFRAYTRTSQVIGDRQDAIIYNAAAPAVDRARAKVEYLFTKDDRLPGGVPAEAVLKSILLNDGTNANSVDADLNTAGVQNRYTLADETPLDLNGDNQADPAWTYTSNGKTVAYSVILNTPIQDSTASGYSAALDLKNLSDTSIQQRANNLLVRNGPLRVLQGTTRNCATAQGNNSAFAGEKGWFSDPSGNTSYLYKAVQINAVVTSNNPDGTINPYKAVATLELEQDRRVDRGNKWAVWFRNDLEIFPGPTFNMNGAVHTEGNMFVSGGKFTSYLISSPNSCLYNKDSSEVSVTEISADTSGYQGFQGQVASGSMGDNDFDSSGGATFHRQISNPGSSGITLKSSNDSVSPPSGTVFGNLALDPITLFTENKSQSRQAADPSNKNLRASTWSSNSVVTDQRILNQRQPAPYVDDTYRADDRFGPKPPPLGSKVGEQIASTNTDLVRNTPPTNEPENLGADGYWERRARVDGLRLIVGQRLELGNTFGWTNSDPLYPPNIPITAITTNSITNEARQQRTLRDNLAAVQSTVVYHKAISQDAPIACLATTVHPGTATTLANSTTFNNFESTTNLATNFLTGNGTNGWEFNASDFSSINDSSSSIRKALKNLALMAGDPYGAFPARQDTALSPAVSAVGPVVHPYSNLSMWGDFSNLRRVIEGKLEATTPVSYADLSIADKSTLDTAGCTLGMLAYNFKGLNDSYNAILAEMESNPANALGGKLFQLMDGIANTGNEEKGTNFQGLCDSGPNAANPCPVTYDPNWYSQFKSDDWIKALLNTSGLGSADAKAQIVRQFQIISEELQIERDRTLGFATGVGLPGTSPGYDQANATYTVQGTLNARVGPGTKFRVACDPKRFAPLGSNSEQSNLGMAMAFCSVSQKPKYPSLYYLFPAVDHNHVGSGSGTVSQTSSGDKYATDLYITNAAINGAKTYQTFSPSDIQVLPKAHSAWSLGSSTTVTGKPNVIKVLTSGTVVPIAVPFLDKAFFNSREMMNVRVLDLDLDLLRSTAIGTNETILPAGGIVYAFREDAAREDAISRPASGDWATCRADLTAINCHMKPSVVSPQDPPVDPSNLVSPKPVDYYAEPDRRPYGFRLRNGLQLKRGGTVANQNNINGLSLITDSSVYIQGNFNPHSTDGSVTTSNLLEEFTTKVSDSWDNFYSRSALESRFAKPFTATGTDSDTWRPVEILADAVTILSDSFCDGSIQDSFVFNNGGTNNNPLAIDDNAKNDTVDRSIYGCGSGNGLTSYLNQNRVGDNVSSATSWRRENPEDNSTSPTSPVLVNSNGAPVLSSGTPYPGSYYSFNDGKAVQGATDTRVNAVIISGIVPSRAGQTYGGLHNFPRFIEDWTGDDLYLSGALLQLNFSTSATGPYDQDSWEPPTGADAFNERIKYYSPPNRKWGYDVGLQLAPAGPVSKRFTTPGNSRSEFYHEPSADDPYIKKLLCGDRDLSSNVNRVDPTANCS
ncbi:hormogonium polysaccharide biosynthesis protein HpsA [Leptolyngbya sp. FACHB-261]|uniref:hormogonium polysaccharide biosynthesis protein HpsA n=1 Tax=Leptolyngbya sp. FACHB-261 TaxID=2692806 RepID=UPI00168A008D|nr:hormogonium polysaccharide biosynthesis protein HpsA [Leptolyngbya sp. FACHB-261]MBD2100830.1 hypothetical protein [Leptolyngbya sp. FACHB-261]